MLQFFIYPLDLTNPSIWLILGCALMLAEIFVPGVYLLWIGLAGLGTGIVAWVFPGISWEWLTSGFAVAALAMCLLASRFYGKHAPSDINRRAEALIGQTAILITDIKDGSGRAKIGDITWRVEGEDMPAGTSVAVKSVSGTTLKVERTV